MGELSIVHVFGLDGAVGCAAVARVSCRPALMHTLSATAAILVTAGHLL